ncbi:MgtC/SapB family protein [Ideonella sp. B7]|nr:MgtC/SapB family protein [Ideonella benzenivorans]
MRTYSLVCMASAALTVMTGYPSAWYGGFDGTAALHTGDPTRVIQGIVTGIGFLGAGVIMKDGLTISGLTTAASIWAAAAILLALLCAGTMMWGAKVEAWLPSHHALGVTIQLAAGAALEAAALDTFLRGLGYELAPGSLSLRCEAGLTEWRFVAIIQRRSEAAPLDALAQALGRQAWVAGYTLAPARN